MKTIVAPTDFSPVSLNAVNYAADLACFMNAGLSLVHVFQLPVIYMEVPVAAGNIDEPLKEAEEKIKQLKDIITERTERKIAVYSKVIVGSVIHEIDKFCSSANPNIVVIGTQDAGAFERFFFGSNTISAIRNLSWPLIIVPPEAKFSAIKKIGLACDLKKTAPSDHLDEIRALIKAFAAELHIMHVNRDSERIYTEETKEESGLLQMQLEDLNPVYHFLSNTDVDGGLSEFAVKNQLDLLIAVPKEHNLIDKLVHKSHTKQLVLHTHIPVMSIHE